MNVSSILRNRIFITASFLVVFAFTGCKAFKPVEDLNRFYVLSAVAKASTEVPANQNLTFGVAPVDLPGYLQSTRITVRRGTNEIYYSDYHQWAEHLDKAVQRVLASDLSSLLPSARVISSAWQPGDVKAEVHVLIQRFDLDESGEVTLECEWRILAPNGGRVLHVDHSLIAKKGPPLAKNPTGAVSTLSQALAELSNQIAAALKNSG
jgi:uncharacterized protein